MTATRSSLLQRVCDMRDAESWSEFDAIYRPLLIRYARQRGLDAESAEDIAQQCLAAVSENIGQFEKRRSFRAWLRGMVDHKVADHLTKHRRHAHAGDERLCDTAAPAPPSPDLWEREWNQSLLQLLIANLRTNFAEHTLQAFELYVLHGMSVREISRLLNLTPNQIYVAKSRVTRHIREQCGEVVESLYGVWP
ncbi:MAG: RNA polymerase sigma factor [Planctomycetota bacterium]